MPTAVPSDESNAAATPGPQPLIEPAAAVGGPVPAVPQPWSEPQVNWGQQLCTQVEQWVPEVLDKSQCLNLYTDGFGWLLSLPLIFLGLLWGLFRAKRARSSNAPARSENAAVEATARRAGAGSPHKQLRRYLEHLAIQHGSLRVLGREVPIPLADIYIGLKASPHQNPSFEPDLPAAGTAGVDASLDTDSLAARSGQTLTLRTVLTTESRLVILGEPGGGKSTLMKHLAVAMVRRDPDYGPFARVRTRNRLANALEAVRRRLQGFNVALPGLAASFIALLLWVIGVFVSGAPVTHLIATLVWVYAAYRLLLRDQRKGVKHHWWIAAGLALSLIGWGWFGSTPVWPAAWWATLIATLLWLYPFLVQAPVALLQRLVQGTTHYPLPVFVTLGNLDPEKGPIEDQAAATIQGLTSMPQPQARGLLDARLEAGSCLLLFDGLDEVTDPARRVWVVEELRRLCAAHGVRNQLVVTARREGYQYPLGSPWAHMELERFRPPQVVDYVRHWFKACGTPADRVEGLLCALRRPGLSSFAGNPLVLALIAHLYTRGGIDEIPERRSALYAKVFHLITEGWNKDTDQRDRPRGQTLPGEVLRCGLRELAAGAHARGLRVMDEATLLALIAGAAGRCQPGVDAAEFLLAIQDETGALRRLSANAFDFAHLTLQEYLAADAVRLQGKQDALLAKTGEPWWREVIRFYAGLASDPGAWVARVLPADPLLAAGCLADARLDPADPASALAAAPVIETLEGLLRGNPDQQQAAADALAEIAEHGAEHALSRALMEYEARPELALAAVLALAPGNEASLPSRFPGGLGGLLRLLHAQLPLVGAGPRGRILATLEGLGFPLCFVPAGTFPMGSDSRWFAHERPIHPVTLADYWIDRAPVTNVQFRRFAEETGFTGGLWEQVAEGRESHPVVLVSWAEAQAYCDWCGKRLPTEAEWEKAARGTDGRRYPWGDAWDAARCNLNGVGTTPVGAHRDGQSPYGCHDMAGNVFEWCADWYDAGYYARSPAENPKGPDTGRLRVVRGGSWFETPALARAAYRYRDLPEYRYGHIGFRAVCVSPIR